MSKINTHSQPMHGLRAACSATKDLRGYYSGLYVELHYNTATGEVLHHLHCSFGQNTWTVYDDDKIVRIGNVSEPCTMQEIADLIHDKLAEITAEANWLEQHAE